jgi:hypothetical protein
VILHLENTHYKKGRVEWLKVKAQSSKKIKTGRKKTKEHLGPPW